MTAVWYWLVFAIVAVIFATIAALSWWEKRQEKLDAQMWAEMFGGDTYSRRVD